MKRAFTFIVQVPINLITTVEATSLEEAVELVSKQSVKRFCEGCSCCPDNEGEWVVCSSINEDPMKVPLLECLDSSIGCSTNESKARYELLQYAQELWG